MDTVDEMFASAPDYERISDFVASEDIYLVNFSGHMACAGSNGLLIKERTEAMGLGVVAVAFAGCLAIFPIEYACRLGYMEDVSVPRTSLLRTRSGTTIYDLRKDVDYFQRVRGNPAWLAIDFHMVCEEFWTVLRLSLIHI